MARNTNILETNLKKIESLSKELKFIKKKQTKNCEWKNKSEIRNSMDGLKNNRKDRGKKRNLKTEQ